MKRILLVVFTFVLICVMSVSVFAASFTGSYRFVDSDDVVSEVDVTYTTRVGGVSYSRVTIDVQPGYMLYFPNGIPSNGTINDPYAGISARLDSTSVYTRIATSGDVGIRWVVPDNIVGDNIQITWYSDDDDFIPLVVYEEFGSDFVTSIGDAVLDVPTWMGQVLDFVIASPLAVLFGVGIAISLVLLIFVVIRRASWGA